MGIAAVGGGSVSGKGVTSLTTASYTSTKTNQIVATVHILGTTAANTPTDTVGSSYSQKAAVNNGTTDRTELWGASSAAAGSNAVTVTFAVAQTYVVCAEEYSSASGGFGNTGTSTGSSTSPSVSVTTQDPGNWVVGGAGGNGAGVFLMSAPDVQRQASATSGGKATSNMGGDIGDVPPTTPGSVTLAATISSSEVWTMAAVELRFSVLASQPITTGTSIVKTVTKLLAQSITTLTRGTFTVPAPLKTMTVSQPITSATALIKTVSKPVSQPVTVFSSGTFLHIIFLRATQPITTSPAFTKTVTKVVTQPVTSATQLVKTVSKPVIQPITVGTAVIKTASKNVTQPVTVLSSGVFLRIRFLTATQPITTGTSVIKTISKLVTQPLTVGTSLVKTVSKPVTQPVTVGTSVTKNVSKLVSQPVTVLSSGTFLHIVFLTVTQPIHVLPTYVRSVVTKVLAQGVHVLTTGITPSSGPKTLNVTQPVTVLTVFISSGSNVGYYWGSTPPTSPALGTVWMDTLAVVLKKWNGSGWVPVP